ncbi:unnamed protein product [Hyaloperonospora brassicae]|uniref:Uncharacterized protein n=1 Tax=Hyaloperonospora brassicae TaxID=162125 RepID=A0AAV0TRC6_HYABA|nr:unnamed protein product [Hyaloperonospora brassicae]
MWLNSRDIARDDDSSNSTTGGGHPDGVWTFAGSSVSSASSSHGSIGASGSRALWNRMEMAEEEREEEALPSYLSYLQPAFRPAPRPSSTTDASTLPRTASVLATPHVREPMDTSLHVQHVTRKSAELAEALEHLVLGAAHRYGNETVVSGTRNRSLSRSLCSCGELRLQVHEMGTQVTRLQEQVLELTKKSSRLEGDSSKGTGTSSTSSSTWSASAAPFVPKQLPYKQLTPSLSIGTVDSSTATVLSDRISTLEGRQSAFQSQLATIAKVLGIPTGKAGKHSPVKHLVETLREEVEAKVQEATAEARAGLLAELKASLGDDEVEPHTDKEDTQAALSSNAVLAALAGEHEASLARLSRSFEELLADEARQRAALEARVQSQLAQQEEWLQQLEGAFGSHHDLNYNQDFRGKDSDVVNSKLEALERRCEESLDFCKRIAQLLPDVAQSSLPSRPGEKENGRSSWPDRMAGSGQVRVGNVVLYCVTFSAQHSQCSYLYSFLLQFIEASRKGQCTYGEMPAVVVKIPRQQWIEAVWISGRTGLKPYAGATSRDRAVQQLLRKERQWMAARPQRSSAR